MIGKYEQREDETKEWRKRWSAPSIS